MGPPASEMKSEGFNFFAPSWGCVNLSGRLWEHSLARQGCNPICAATPPKDLRVRAAV